MATNISLSWAPNCSLSGTVCSVVTTSVLIVWSTGTINITNGTAGAVYKVPTDAYVTAGGATSPSGWNYIILGSGYTVSQGSCRYQSTLQTCVVVTNGYAGPIYGNTYLQSVTISTPNTIIGIYQNSTISITLGSGGSGNYTYQWYVDNASVSGGTTSTYVFSSTVAAVHSVYVVVTDTSYNHTTQSNILNIQVVSAPSVSYYVSGSYLEVGQVCQLNAAVSGGTGLYKYQWYVDGGEIEYANSPLLLYYPTSSGNHVFSLDVTDIGLSTPYDYGKIGSVVVEFYTPLALTVSPITATILNSSSGSGNTTATITVTATGGSGQYSYQWYADDSIVSGGTTSTYVFSSSDAGVHNIYCEVTDTNSHYVAVTQDVLVNVVGGLSVGVSPTSLDAAVGYQFTLVGSVSGGSGNYSYQWLQNSSASPVGATVVGSSQSYNGKFNSTGVWYYYFVATDNVTNNSATSSAVVVTVSSDIFATLSASETNVVVNSTVTLSLNIFGGNGNWTATWYQVINGTQTVLASGSVSTLQVSQSSPTSADYFVIVSDTSNGNPYKTSTVHITWATFVANISSSSSMVSTGTSYIITMSESGGVTPLTYTLYENGTSIFSSSKTNSNSISDSISKNTAGTYSYYVTVIDYDNNSATSGAISVIVTSNVGLNLTTSTSLIPYNSGQVATLTATAANVSGTPSYNIYETTPSGSTTQVVTNSTVNTYVFNPSGLAQGKYTFYATVSGSNGSATSNNVYIEYSKASAVSTTVSISDSLTYQYIAGGGSISANSPSGQTGNFTVTWNGTVVPAFDITLDRRLNYAGELDFKIPKGYSINKNDLIQFYYWGNVKFIGRVKEVTKYSDYVYEVKAYDGLYELGGITYGLLPRSNNMSIDSMLKYFINQCKYFGYGSMWNEITQPVGVDFGGSNVLPNLLQLVFAYNGHIAMDNYGNINLFITSGTTMATRTIIENNGYIVQSKEYDNTRIYTKITAVAFDTDKNNQKVSYSTGTGNGKVIGDGWLYLKDSEINSVLQTIANNIIGQTSQGNYIVTVWTGAHSTFDFPDNSNGAPYLYTINFADGTTLNNMLLAGIKITQSGVTYTFKQYDDTIIDYLLTSIEK